MIYDGTIEFDEPVLTFTSDDTEIMFTSGDE